MDDTRYFRSFAQALAMCLLLSGCLPEGAPGEGGENDRFSGGWNQSGEGGPAPTDGGEIGRDDNGRDTDGGFISHFKPALVVRATGCIMCHARVEANIVTDFGFGSDYFFGKGTPGVSEFNGAIYGDHAENWRTGKVHGSVLVPRAPLTYGSGSSRVDTTLAEYLRATVTAPDASTPPPEVIERNTVYIGAPTRERILEVSGGGPQGHIPWRYFPQASGQQLSGLRVSIDEKYVRNDDFRPLVCEGDLVVDKVLFLNNLQLSTGNRGCRIYATATVFIQGPITYLGSAPRRNLQITSSRAILLGLGASANDIHESPNRHSATYRLQEFWTIPGFHTRDERLSTQEKLDLIAEDSLLIPELIDASVQEPHYRAVAFERLFINAPNIQSRYQGEFRGVIVAELVLGSLSQFAFRFDEVFEKVPILPLLRESDYIRVE